MSVEWHPPEHAVEQGQRSYLGYLAGVAMLNTPSSEFVQGMLGEGTDITEDIIPQAEALMYQGARGVIKYANDPRIPGGMGGIEGSYVVAYPHMQRMVEQAYSRHAKQIAVANLALAYLQPAPFLDAVTYGYLCHSRRGKILTVSMMDGVQPAVCFQDALQGRLLSESNLAEV